jgi:hypothetical protein
MVYLEKVKRGRQDRPRRTLLYGVHGVGKSTFASQFPSPIFLPIEDGVSDLDVASFPIPRTITDVYGSIIELTSVEHDFKTLVIDSADWLERLIWKKVCEIGGKQCITDFDYGKGYGKAAEIFSELLASFDQVREVGMNIILIAHADIKKFANPEGDSYDRYVPKMHETCGSRAMEWADEVLFATYKTYVRQTQEGFGQHRGIGVGQGERVIRTSERPSHMAKNRLGMPDELPLNYEVYAQFLK